MLIAPDIFRRWLETPAFRNEVLADELGTVRDRDPLAASL